MKDFWEIPTQEERRDNLFSFQKEENDYFCYSNSINDVTNYFSNQFANYFFTYYLNYSFNFLLYVLEPSYSDDTCKIK